MKIHELPADPGIQEKRKRRGRGEGSGLGKSAGHGNKGKQARSGAAKSGAFEGGQMPLVRRVPKRGFHNPFRKAYQGVNVSALQKAFEDGATVDRDALVKAGLAKKSEERIKILGDGELSKKLTVKASAFSASAKEKITAAGGTAEVI
jgi:large subunit ribosomal protein L15